MEELEKLIKVIKAMAEETITVHCHRPLIFIDRFRDSTTWLCPDCREYLTATLYKTEYESEDGDARYHYGVQYSKPVKERRRIDVDPEFRRRYEKLQCQFEEERRKILTPPPAAPECFSQFKGGENVVCTACGFRQQCAEAWWWTKKFE